MVNSKKNFSDSESRFDGRYASTIYQTLWLAYKPYIGLMSLCLLFGFLGRVLLLANANVMGLWVDARAHEGSSTDLYLPLLISMTAAGFVMTLVFRVYFSRLSAQAVSQVYDEVTMRTSRYPLSFFDRTPTGRVVTRFSSDYGNVFRLFGGPLAEFLSIVFDLIAMVFLIAIANPLYLFIVLFVGVLNYLVWRSQRQKLRNSRRDLSASRSPSIAHFAETAQGASTVRSFNKEQSFFDRFRNLDQGFLNQKLKTTSEIVSYSFKMNSLTALLFLLTGIFASLWIEKGWVSIGSLGVALGFITLSGTTVQMFFEWMAQFEEAMVGLERLDQYLRMPIEPGSLLPSSSQIQTDHLRWTTEGEKRTEKERWTEQRAASVSFKNVWFRYRDDLPFVLKNLNLEIKAGERFGIIGRTGSGKSSLIQALFQLYPLSEGRIEIAGFQPEFENPLAPSPEHKNLEVFRRALAFISQESVLIKGSLRQNLDITGRSSDSRMQEALGRVGLEEFARPDRLDLEIEERGRNLSLGEKQLICMARCLLQNSPVVIMDEATSSIDPQSEEIIVKATDEIFQGRTQIIIAHRLSTLKKCDRILWLHQGEVRGLGKPEEILPSFQNQ